MSSGAPAYGLRALFTLRESPRRWPFAIRASICMGAPVLAGVMAGRPEDGLMATIGAFTALYGSGRPYLYRAAMLAMIAVAFAVAVGLGLAASHSHVAALLTVTAIAMAATLLCRELNTGPPGAYLFVLACAAGTAMPAAHLRPHHVAALVLAGGAFAWLAHMVGVLYRPRQPEKIAVLQATRATGAFIRALGTPKQEAARHAAALLLQDAWSALVTYQPLHRRADSVVGRLRAVNRELHLLFASALEHAGRNEPMPASALEDARRIAALARNPEGIEPARHDQVPLGRLGPVDAMREALQPGSMALLVVLRVGLASLIAGIVGAAMALEHVYWSIAAAVLVLHYGYDWRRTVQRGIERLAGTWIGLALAALVLWAYPQGLWLVATIMALQFVLQVLVTRNYALAVVFITAVALLIASGGHALEGNGELLWVRGLDTTLGCVIGIAVFALLAPRAVMARVRTELGATLEAIAPVLTLVERGEVTTPEAWRERRGLQHRVFRLAEAYEGGVGGRARERRDAEQVWPFVASAQRLAYRALSLAWRVERGEAIPASEVDDLAREVRALQETLQGRAT